MEEPVCSGRGMRAVGGHQRRSVLRQNVQRYIPARVFSQPFEDPIKMIDPSNLPSWHDGMRAVASSFLIFHVVRQVRNSSTNLMHVAEDYDTYGRPLFFRPVTV